MESKMQAMRSRAGSHFSKTWHKMWRTKVIDTQTDLMETQLRRCLSTFDIVLLGIGHMVGSGAYVLTSSVARNISGPAIVLSFIISGFASFLSALCYAEFAGRFPKCGSAYSYSYLALGEFWSFVVGWNMILENVIGTAAVSRACSAYIDSLMDGHIKNYTMASLTSSIGLNYFSEHVDVFAFLIVVVLVIFLSSGVKITTYLNNLFSIINISVILVIIVVGLYYSDLDNWRNAPNGFMAFGWKGVFAGSATCFYAYIGFDSIASSGEEAKDPQKSIPLATFISMAFATVAYVSVSAVLTLMIPYNEINAESGLPDALGAHGAVWAKLVVIVGACCGMVTVLIGTMYSLTRIVYAMSDDGLLFSWMGSVNPRNQIPLNAMYFFSSIGAILAMFVEITTLIEMMSIGTLIAYLVVSASVIVIRYQPICELDLQELNIEAIQELNDLSVEHHNEESKLIDELVVNEPSANPSSGHTTRHNIFWRLRERILLKIINYCPKSLLSICVMSLVILIFAFCLVVKHYNQVYSNQMFDTTVITIIAILFLFVLFLISLHKPIEMPQMSYKVPFVPLLPTLSMFFNIGLMVNLESLTWFRLVFWMIIGFTIYFFYGINQSKADHNCKQLQAINSEDVRKWGSLDDTSCLTDNISMSSTY